MMQGSRSMDEIDCHPTSFKIGIAAGLIEKRDVRSLISLQVSSAILGMPVN